MDFYDFFSGLGFDAFNQKCQDIPFGFQDVSPELFTVIGEVVGNIMAGNMPINVQNSIGNWFELLGQVILTYSAQQQYFQNGPGRFYSPIYKNVGNPFCNGGSAAASESATNVDNLAREQNRSSEGSNNRDNMSDLYEQIKYLHIEINNLKSEIENIRNS